MKSKTKRPSPEQGLFSFDPATNYVMMMIMDYLQKDIPSVIYGKRESIQQSYSRWASKELLSRLQTGSDPPLDILEHFRDEMIRYAGYNSAARIIFYTAEKTCEYFIRLLT